MVVVSRKRAILLRCGLVLFGLALACGTAEVGLRLIGMGFPRPYVADEYTGSRLRPGWSGWFSKEGRAWATINSAGFRDREHAREKPANTFRILVLGDSYVEAVQVAEQDTFWSGLEQQLQPEFQRQGKRLEVLAMGVSGWGTAQECLALEQYGVDYQPDLVVLAFLAANDLRNNSRELEGDAARPYFVLEEDQLRLDTSFRTDPDFLKAQSRMTAIKVALINRSRLLQWIQEIRERRRGAIQAPQTSLEAGLDAAIFVPPSTEAWKTTWEVTERLIERMHAACAAHGSRLCVLAVNSAIQVRPEASRRETLQRHLGVSSLDYSDRRIQELGERIGFPVIVVAQPLREYAEKHQQHLHGFPNTVWGEGHWNETGHRLVGEYLARRLAAELLEKERASSLTGAPAGLATRSRFAAAR